MDSQYKLQEIYKNSSASVRASQYSEENASQTFANYLNFIDEVSQEKGSLLDCGCGSGWSSYLLAKNGFSVTGIDLNAEAFEPPKLDSLSLRQESVLDLPFPDRSFDIVSSYQMLEHVPDPLAGLEEMVRVLKPGGILFVVGPNCLGLIPSIKVAGRNVWRNRPIHTIFVRVPGMPRHPSGNTFPEAIGNLFLNVFRVIFKAVSPTVSFTMREPDLIPPFHGDNDACYLLNPIDLVKFCAERNLDVIQNGKHGRPGFTCLLAGGTYFAARKK